MVVLVELPDLVNPNEARSKQEGPISISSEAQKIIPEGNDISCQSAFKVTMV